MSAKLDWFGVSKLLIILSCSIFANPLAAFAQNTGIIKFGCPLPPGPSMGIASANNNALITNEIAKQLGWVASSENYCGGYYLEQALAPSGLPEGSKAVGITTDVGFLAQHNTSILEGNVTVRRSGQEITANRAYLYRDPISGKLIAIDMIGDVHLREAYTLIVGKKGRYDFKTTSKTLYNITYRTTLDPRHSMAQQAVQTVSTDSSVRTANVTAFGEAKEFSQQEPRVYEMYQSSYSTCPPINPTWQVRASHILLDKNTGRGYATNARILVKNVPVFYLPYVNFPLDKRRKSGFLWPVAGGSNKWGPFIQTPFYWNMAPNYDMTFTPGFLSKRGVQLSDQFRYLTTIGYGDLRITVLPNDRAFQQFQQDAATNPSYLYPTLAQGQIPEITTAELSRLLNASDTRKSLLYRDDSRFNQNWSSHIELNVVSDDYYLQDFGRTLSEIPENQLLQEGDLYYKSPNWNFTGRLQAYQTLHRINAATVSNEYQRMPQLILNGDYPDQAFGLEYFIQTEATRFDKRKTPGSFEIPTIGNRYHLQPGVSLPLYWPYFYLNPRLQVALTAYELQRHPFVGVGGNPALLMDDQLLNPAAPEMLKRSIPILDVVSGVNFTRDTRLFHTNYTQTLEPQLYYVYIPYHDQSRIPVFDTTVNTLTYDQIFNYNRFTGIDRIGDANQLGFGITTRLIDQTTGEEKVRIGAGTIWYFAHRRVTLCNTRACVDNPSNPGNDQGLSPISGLLQYHINPAWNFNTNVIWNPIWKQMDNATVAFQYAPDNQRLLNLAYTYARSGILSGVQTPESIDNLKVTDVSFVYPLKDTLSIVGRWSENWNRAHLQNLVGGLQYDTCCWTMRIVGGRAFAGFDTLQNNQPKYTSEVSLQFTLKGLGDFSTSNPGGLLNGIPGYKSQFGQEL